LHNRLWEKANRKDFAFRKIYDVLTALSLQHHGVTEFARRNVKDFQNLGFQRVWDPTQSKTTL